MRLLLALALAAIPSVGEATTPLLSFTKDGDETTARFCADLGGIHYTLSSSGRLTTRHGASTRVPISKGEYVQWAWISPKGSDLLVAYEATSPGEYTYGQLCKLHGTTLSKRWCSNIEGFNVVIGMEGTKHAYVGSIGTVGKINLANGRYDWVNRGLYERSGAYNIFSLPVVLGEQVTFLATDGTRGGTERTLTLNTRSGKVVQESDGITAGTEIKGLQRTEGTCAR